MDDEREDPQDPAAPQDRHDPESPGSWFFDPPGGAWQRQEALNRELRERVSENIDDSRRRRDVFRAPDADLIDEPEKKGLFGRAKRKRDDRTSWSSPGGTFALGKEADRGRVEPTSRGAPPPIRRRKPGEEREEGWQRDEWHEDRMRESSPAEPPEPAAPPGERRRRFDEVFGGRVEGMSITDSMRESWRQPAAEVPQPTPEHFEEAPFERSRDEQPEAPPAREPAAGERRTRWDELFSGRADGGMLDAMRKWSSTPPETHQRRVLGAEGEAVADPTLRRPWEDASEPGARDAAPEVPVEAKEGLFSKLGAMFRRKPGAEREQLPEYESAPSGRWTAPPMAQPSALEDEDEATPVMFESAFALAPARPETPMGPDPFAMATPGPVDVVEVVHETEAAVEWNTEDSWQPEEPAEEAVVLTPGEAALEVASPLAEVESAVHFEDSWQPDEFAEESVIVDLAEAQGEVPPPVAVDASTFVVEDSWQPEEPISPLVPSVARTVGWDQAGGVPRPDSSAGDDVDFFEDVLEPAAQLADLADGEAAEEVARTPEAEAVQATASYEPEPAMSEPQPTALDDPWADFVARRQAALDVESRPAAQADDGYDLASARAGSGPSPVTPGNEIPRNSSPDQQTAASPTADYDELLGLGTAEPAPPPPLAGARGLLASRKPLSERYEDPSRQRQEPRDEFRPAASMPGPKYDLDDDPRHAGAEDEMDVVLKAFEHHAAQGERAIRHDDGLHAEAGVFDAIEDLLGEGADELIDAPEAPVERRPFTTMNRWAPQRDSASLLEATNAWDVAAQVSDPEATPPAASPPRGWGAFDEDEGDIAVGAERPADGGMAPVAVVPRSGHSKTKNLVRELVETGLLALLVFLAVRASFQNFKVDGDSMFPTLEDGEFLIVNKLVYSEVDVERLSEFVPFVDAGNDPERNVFHGPQRGDIVVFHDPRNPSVDLIKRIVGLPGETVEIVDGKVYINDYLLEEPYIKSEWRDNKPKVRLPDDEYFVMGDNRANSLDSRSIGLVHRDLVIGKAMVTYWPRSKFGLAPNEKPHVSDTQVSPNLAAALGQD